MFDMFGPYHLARLNALGEKTSLLGLEVVRRSEIYAWTPIGAATTFTRKTLFEDDGLRETRYHVMADRIAAAVSRAASTWSGQPPPKLVLANAITGIFDALSAASSCGVNGLSWS